MDEQYLSTLVSNSVISLFNQEPVPSEEYFTLLPGDTAIHDLLIDNIEVSFVRAILPVILSEGYVNDSRELIKNLTVQFLTMSIMIKRLFITNEMIDKFNKTMKELTDKEKEEFSISDLAKIEYGDKIIAVNAIQSTLINILKLFIINVISRFKNGEENIPKTQIVLTGITYFIRALNKIGSPDKSELQTQELADRIVLSLIKNDELYKEEDRFVEKFGASLAEHIEFPYNKKLMEKFLGLTVELMNIVLDEIIEEFNKLHKDGNN